MTAHDFDAAIDLEPLGDGRFRGHTHPAYANMVGPFGGITAAVLTRAVEVHPDRLGEPLALTVNYAGPVADGEFEIRLDAVRTNRTTQHWTLELTQDGAVATTATAVLGQRRETWSDTEARMPQAPPPDELPVSPVPPVTWAQRYEMRFAEGPVPGHGVKPADTSTSTLWVRDSPTRPLDFTALTALCDIFVPRVYIRQARMMPAGTVSLTVHFHAVGDELRDQGDDYVLASASASRFSAGWADQSATIWSRAGVLLATTHQLVYFKD